MASLSERGFRFLHVCGDRYEWRHPADLQTYVTDCTEMDDEAFERYVTSQPPSQQPQGAG